MLSKRTKKGIVYGFRGALAGFFAAAVTLFAILLIFDVLPSSFLCDSYPIYPINIFITGIIVPYFILVLSRILGIKRFGILASAVYFFLFFVIMIKTCNLPNLPIQSGMYGGTESKLLYLLIHSIPLLVWVMFIIEAVKAGLSKIDR